MSKKKTYQIRQSPGDPLARERKGYYVDEIEVVYNRDWIVGPFDTEKEARDAAKDVAGALIDKVNVSVKRDIVRGSLEEVRKRKG